MGKCVTDHPQPSTRIIAEMSYLVLPRKLRPSKFRDLIGQESICETLVNAINTNRVAHAFLFTGPRGTGKTSCARILTKALNCQSPIDSEPCNQCDNCKEINLGVSTDVLEIDAASNRGIEHIRELKEGVKFSPAKCKYKTYIIDEVHMLTTESFNALLKTLEEPPFHVKFILATTDHYKIPPTVISRCQRYDFSNIPTELIVDYLRKVAKNEKINIGESALYLIARSSMGGMRDALTILDMLISFSEEEIKDEKVIEVLGLNDVREIDNLLKCIINKKLAAALSLWSALLAKGRSIMRLIADLMRALKNLSLVKILPEDKIQWHQFLPDQLELYKDLSSITTASSLQRLFDIMLEVEGQVKRSAQAKICFEMGLIKMCSLESLAGVAEIVSILREAGEKPGARQPLFNKGRAENGRGISGKTKLDRDKDLNRIENINQSRLENDKHEPQKAYFHNLNERSSLALKDPGPFEETSAITTQKELAQLNDNTPEKRDVPSQKKESLFDQWRNFIDYITPNSGRSLVSLLNNSTPLELNSRKLEIGYGNIEIFDEEKKKHINQAAQTFFNPSLKVVYRKHEDKSGNGTLRGREEKEKNKREDEKRRIASQDPKVKEILELFPDSRITKVEILQE